MTCYKPLSIRNRVKGFNRQVDRSRLVVPCGHCVGCQKEKQLNWFVRLYYHYLGYKLTGGTALFLTLTYNNNSIPKHYGYYCFDKKDIQNYIKRIRKRYEKQISYFISCEYGSRTFRPHYHLILFIPTFADALRVKRIAREEWYFGFTKVGSRNGGFVDSPGALTYCAKYTVKDLEHLPTFRQKICETFKSADLDISKFIPFTLASNHLGEFALSFCNYETIQKGLINIPDKKGITLTVKLPLYLDRKVHFDVKFKTYIENIDAYSITDEKLDEFSIPVYVPNSLGLYAKAIRLDKYIQNYVDMVDTVKNVTYLPNDKLQELNDKFETHFDTFRQVQDFLKKQVDSFDIAVYNNVYRGFSPIISYNDDYSDVPQTDFATDFITRLRQKYGQLNNQDLVKSFQLNLYSYDDETTRQLDLYSDIIQYIYTAWIIPKEEKLQKLNRIRRDNSTMYHKFKLKNYA